MAQTSTAKTKAVKSGATKKKAPVKAKAPVAPKATVTKPKSVAVTGKLLNAGHKAPAFNLAATDVGRVSLSAMKGQAFVLYFYPKDDTSGCTAEACGFRDAMPKFDQLGVAVIAVSKDPLISHEKFKKKFDLDFPLATDETGKVCEAYGVWVEKSMYGRKYMGIERSTFLIDATGMIRAVWRHVSVPGHVEQVRKAAAEL